MSSARQRTVDVPVLVEEIRAGRPRAVGRAISLVEDAHPCLPELMAALAPTAGRAHVVGLTGSPGVGKSTTTNALVRELRSQDLVVGVLAVDPSSPFTGGALLGDRIRMEEHATDRGVFLRSMASRGHLGGLAWATPQAVRVLDAAGCDVVLVETVGVGQSEVEVVGASDTTIVLLAPGMGDGIQAAKAGILEIGDVFVVNKADREGADRTVRDLRHMVQMSDRTQPGLWRPPVIRAAAISADGMSEIADAVAAHRTWLADRGEGAARRARRAREEIEALAVRALMRRLDPAVLDDLARSVVAGDLDAYAAAQRLVGPLTSR